MSDDAGVFWNVELQAQDYLAGARVVGFVPMRPSAKGPVRVLHGGFLTTTCRTGRRAIDMTVPQTPARHLETPWSCTYACLQTRARALGGTAAGESCARSSSVVVSTVTATD